MSAVSSSANGDTGRGEQLIGAVIPPATGRSVPAVPLVVPVLPVLGLPAGEESGPFLLDMARLDGSGRFSARGLLQALGWEPGRRVDMAVVGDAVVFGSCVTGRQVVGSRGELAVPAAARSLAGIDTDAPVVLVAATAQGLLVVHPQAVVLRLLAQYYAQQSGGGDDG